MESVNQKGTDNQKQQFMQFFQKIKDFFQKIKDYDFDCFKDENPTLWTNIQKCFWTLVHGFVCDEYTSRAASLTYYTVTSIVPFIALIRILIPEKGIEPIQEMLKYLLPVTKDASSNIFMFFENKSIDGDVTFWVSIGTILAMVWATYSLFYNLIHTMNATIWGVEDRAIGKRIVFYVCTMAVIVGFTWLAYPILTSIRIDAWGFYAIAFIGSFLIYWLFPNVSYYSEKSKRTPMLPATKYGPKWKGSFCGAVLFATLLCIISFLASIFSDKIIERYITNYGKTFYIIFILLTWIWGFFVLFLSCAKIGQFIDYPKQNDAKPIEENLIRKGLEFLQTLQSFIHNHSIIKIKKH